MFEQSLMDLASTEKKRPWTVFISLMIQASILIALILIPLLTVEALPKTSMLGFLTAPPPPPPPPPPPAAAPIKVVKMVREFEDGHLTAPKEIPKEIKQITEEDLPPPSSGGAGVVGGVPGGTPGGQLGGVIGGIVSSTPTNAPPPPPPPPPPKVETPKRITVGGSVQAAMAISRPSPVYPQLARQARIQGVVRLEAVIDETGKITDLKVVSGHPLLVQSALDAVRQWRYRPTILNNVPVQVATTIDVNFTLSQ
jgi:protein TonB